MSVEGKSSYCSVTSRVSVFGDNDNVGLYENVRHASVFRSTMVVERLVTKTSFVALGRREFRHESGFRSTRRVRSLGTKASSIAQGELGILAQK